MARTNATGVIATLVITRLLARIVGSYLNRHTIHDGKNCNHIGVITGKNCNQVGKPRFPVPFTMVRIMTSGFAEIMVCPAA